MTLRDDLFSFLEELPVWQRDLAKRLVARPQLAGNDYDEAMRVAKGAFGALDECVESPELQPLTLNDLPGAATAGGAPRLISFGRLHGVGAVSADHALRFQPDGLTVIYGQNAAGKTSYVRGLKRVCRTVDRDAEVRGNVYVAPTGTAPTAIVEYTVGGDHRAHQVNLSDPPTLGLEAISVFDSECAELYVDHENAIAYVPSPLLLLARLATLQTRLRGDIRAEADALAAQAPALPEFDSAPTLRGQLAAISAHTSIDVFRTIAALTDAERARIVEVRAVVASAEAQIARAEADAARQDATQARALSEQLRQLAERVGPAAVRMLNDRAAEAAAANEAVELAAREFSGLPVPGIGSDPWRRLWQAAREFGEQTSAAFPPGAGQRCPVCLQELRAEAAERMAHFEQHVRGAVAQQGRNAQAALATAIATLDPRHVAALRTPFVASLAERDPELHGAIDAFLASIEARTAELREDPLRSQHDPLSVDAITRLDAWGEARQAHAETLNAANDPEGQQALRQELSELEGREKLGLRLADIEAWIATLKRIEALNQAFSGLATNRITTKQRELTEGAVTGVLGVSLNDELRSLHCEHMPVELHPQTAVGETQVELRLAGAHGAPSVSKIASEGEQRALALAFFFAEVAISSTDGGIIVDDPVSSLDDERRAHIARRLVEEAQRRQVVVLTHDLPFMLDLLNLAEKVGLEPLVEGVWRLGAEVGRVDDNPPFKAMKLKQRVATLIQRVQEWDYQSVAASYDEEWRRVSGFYSDMRITWERAVEERLFRGVVQRFQREVKTLALKDVEITPELVAAVEEGMTRCSEFVHDQPPGASITLPGRQQLAADLEKLREFEKHTRS